MTIIITLKDSLSLSNESKDLFIELYKTDIETQTFVPLTNSFNSHSVMLERFSNKCLNCDLQSSPGLIYRLCSDIKCTSDIFNSTSLIYSGLYLFLTYSDHRYNYKRAINHVEILVNSKQLILDKDYQVENKFLGTNSGKLIKLGLDYTGEMNFEVRVRYYDPLDLISNSSSYSSGSSS